MAKTNPTDPRPLDDDREPAADADLRSLFHRTSPPVPPVDLEALLGQEPRTPWNLVRRLVGPWADDPRSPRSWRYSTMLRIAAALILLAAPALLLWPGRPAAAISLDDVRQAVDATRTVTLTTEQDSPAPGGPPMRTRVLIQAPSLMRVEMENSYTVIDMAARRTIAVNLADKRVMIVENQRAGLADLPPDFSFYGLIRGLADREARPLDSRTIDGREAIGFQIDEPLLPASSQGPPRPQPTTTRVWVDPATRLPVRVESVMKVEAVTKSDPGERTEVMTDFVFDQELDPALFSFDIPEGFEVDRLGVAELKPAPTEAEAADLVLMGTGLGPVSFGDSKEACLDAFGEPDRVETFVGGELLQYFSRGFNLTVGDERGLRMIHCYSDRDMAFAVYPFPGRTAEGIALGASRDHIEAAYGEPSHVRVSLLRDALGDDAPNADVPTGQVSLTYNEQGLTFTLQDGTLYDIMAQPLRPAEPR